MWWKKGIDGKTWVLRWKRLEISINKIISNIKIIYLHNYFQTYFILQMNIFISLLEFLIFVLSPILMYVKEKHSFECVPSWEYSLYFLNQCLSKKFMGIINWWSSMGVTNHWVGKNISKFHKYCWWKRMILELRCTLLHPTFQTDNVGALFNHVLNLLLLLFANFSQTHKISQNTYNFNIWTICLHILNLPHKNR